MDQPDLYENDILAWSEQQSAALRRLSARRDLPNDLDLDNVAEEIESVGRSELGRAGNFIVLILEHIAKAVSEPEAPAISHWRSECVGWQTQLLRSFSRSMRQRIDMERLWIDALKVAAARLVEHGGELASTLVGACPVTLDDVLSPSFEFHDVVRRIAQT